jgi:hypothetical protein
VPTAATGLEPPTLYGDQPFVSETMRCMSDDFIEINDNTGQNVVRFYVERIERERETEKENV